MDLTATQRLDLTFGQLLRECEHLRDLCQEQQARIAALEAELSGLRPQSPPPAAGSVAQAATG